jgi:ATP-dependent transcriptional regulator
MPAPIISQREQQVLHLVAHEYTTHEIASHLYLSSHTIDTHKKNLKIKLDVRNAAGMIRRGFELGLLQVNYSALR